MAPAAIACRAIPAGNSVAIFQISPNPSQKLTKLLVLKNDGRAKICGILIQKRKNAYDVNCLKSRFVYKGLYQNIISLYLKEKKSSSIIHE